VAGILFLKVFKWNYVQVNRFNREYGRPMKPFFITFPIFGLGQTIWADKFWAFGVFWPNLLNSTHFGTVSPCLSLINHYFYKKVSLYI
jgi:hypothetical protein